MYMPVSRCISVWKEADMNEQVRYIMGEHERPRKCEIWNEHCWIRIWGQRKEIICQVRSMNMLILLDILKNDDG